MDPPLRVLVVYPFLYHYRFGIFTELDRFGEHSYTFATSTSGVDGIATFSRDELRHHIEVRNLRIGPFLVQPKAIALAATSDFDVVVMLGDVKTLSNWIIPIIARLRRRLSSYWTIGWHRPESGAKRRIRLAYYSLVDLLMLYGDLGRNIGETMGYPRRRMHTIGNSVDQPPTLEAETARESALVEGIPQNRRVVGAVIRLNAVKRLDLLIRAVSTMTEETDRPLVAFLGDGPERERLTALAEKLGVCVMFLGPVYSYEALEAFYRRISITVVPSAVGLTAIQSLSFGVPVISDDAEFEQMPEWEAIKPGATGDVYPAGNYRELAAVIARWLNVTQTSADEIARQCVDEVREHWSASSQRRRIEEVLASSARHGRSHVDD